MASLLNTKISNTYVGLIKTIDNAVISSSLRELSDGSGNATGIHLNNAGDFKVTNILEFGSLKDTGENITISKFVDNADGIANNNNDTSIPTSAAIITYVASQITLEDLDFSGDSGTGSVDLDSQVFAIVGTANEIETSAGSQQLQIGLPDNVTIGGNLQVNGLLKGNNNIVVKDTSDRTMAAFYGGGKVELYFNDSKKFETTSDGATVTGGLTATGGSVFTGATFSDNVVLDDNSGASPQIQFINGNNDTAEILLNSSGKLEISTGGTDRLIISSGDTEFTGDIILPDNKKAKFGTGLDLAIYHNGTDSYIENATGNLEIINGSDDKDIIFKSDDGSGGLTEYLRVDGGLVLNEFSQHTRAIDNKFLGVGNSTDLYMVHDGTNSHIKNGTGNLTIEQQVDDADIIFQADDGSGGVTSYFYLDGSQERTNFEKSIRLHDSVKAQFGNSGDLEIFHNGSDSAITNANGDLYITNEANDKDIIFRSDDGSGGFTTYFKLDGSEQIINVSASNGMQFNDNVRIKVGSGTGGDLRIYHDGSNSYISDAGTGDLYIEGTQNVFIRDNATGNAWFQGNQGGVNLRYQGNKKIETTAGGVSITGTIDSTGTISVTGASSNIKIGTDTGKFMAGASNDLQIYHDGTKSVIEDTGTGDLHIIGDNDIVFKDGSGNILANMNAINSVELNFAGSNKFATTNTGVSVTGVIASSGNVTISNASPTLTLTDTDNTNDITFNSVGGALVLNSTSDQVFQIGGTEKFRVGSTTASFSGAVTIAGDLTVNGTTTTVNTDTLAVEDPLISMAKDNSANSVDIGFYGRYNDGSNRYLGLFADASDSNTFNLFKGTTTEPTTTVDVTATGYTLADLNVGNVSLGDNTKITFGAVPDFEIFHNSTTNVNHIQSLLDRQLSINGNTIFLRNQDNDTNFLQINSTNASFGGDISLVDSKTLNIGTGNDLQLIHDGSNSVITNLTGHLYIRNDADDKRIEFQADDGSGGRETYFYCDGAGGGAQPFTVFPDSAVLAMGSNHDMRIEHTGGGAKIENYTGSLTITQHEDDGNIIFNNDNGSGGVHTYFHVDGGADRTIFSRSTRHKDGVISAFGTDEDLQIYHDGSNSYINENGTGVLAIQTNGSEIQLNSTGGEYLARFIPDAGVKLYYNNSLKLETASDGVKVPISDSGTTQSSFGGLHLINTDTTVNNGTSINFAHNTTSSGSHARIGAIYEDRTGSSEDTSLFFGTLGGGSYSERLRIDSDGQIRINPGSIDCVDSGATAFDLQMPNGIAFGGNTFTYCNIFGSGGNMTIAANAYPANTGSASTITFKNSTSSGGTHTPLILDGNNATVGGTTKATTFLINRTTAAGIGASLGDINGAELGPGYLSLSRDDTAEAAQIVFEKNDVEHTRLVTGSDFFAIDTAGDIILDADGGDIFLKDGGTDFGLLANTSNNLVVMSRVQDKDIIFKGNDGGSTITALTLDMSNGGSATFIDDIDLGGKITQTGTSGTNTFNTNVNIASGNLGIGDSTPDYSIEINQANPEIRLEETTSGGSKRLTMKVNSSTSNAEIGANQSAQSLILQTTGSDRLTIDSSGNSTFSGNVSLSGTDGTLLADFSSGGTDRKSEIILYNSTSGALQFKTQNASTGGIEFFTQGTKKLQLSQSSEAHLELTGSAPIFKAESTNNSSGLRIRVAGLNDDADSLVRFQDDGTTVFNMLKNGRANFGSGTGNKGKLTVDGSVTVGSATNDPDISVTQASGSDDVAFTYDSGSIEANIHMTGTTTADCTVTFLYQATSWKSWFLEYKFASTDGGASGHIGGYNNSSLGNDKTTILNGISHSVTVAAAGQQVKVVFTFDSGLGIHPFVHFKYWQGGHDGKPRADRLSVEYEES